MPQKSIKRIFNKIRDAPYRIPLDEGDLDFCCNGKHILLYEGLSEWKLVRPQVVGFRWEKL